MAPVDDFVLTIYDDELVSDEGEEDVPEPAASKKRKRDAAGEEHKKSKASKQDKKRKKAQKEPSPADESDDEPAGQDDGAIDPDFEFQLADGDIGLEEFDGWATRGAGQQQSNGVKKVVDIDEIIARRKKPDEEPANGQVDVDGLGKDEEGEEAALDGEDDDNDELLADDAFGMGADPEDEEASNEGDSDDNDNSAEEEDGSDDEDEVAAPMPHPDDMDAAGSSDEEDEDPAEAEKRAAFFAPESNITGEDQPTSKTGGSFMAMSLSRSILKGLTAVGFTTPTPIQQKSIPVALLGKDVVGSAETGSGKTGAFIIPILERLLYRSKRVATTRVAILMPTRELALQCFSVATKLASFTDVTFGQAIGGLNSREQENALKRRPDIVIATPGRFIDFMRNSSSFAVDTIEILVLDEADRMLEDGFADELNEILTTIPKSRQTMLFSATMSSSVDNLVRVGMNRPVRLMVDAKSQTVAGLTQEFVRLRSGREDRRLGYLLHLCFTIHTARTIIFFRQKKEAHRVRVIFGLLGLKAAELHGSMSQEQRIGAIESFRSGSVNFLLATDLASRGLDIKNIETVINYEAPQSHEIYLHRVGRTARAGRTGRSCTIAAEPDRKVVKAAVKAARAQGAIIKSRLVDPADADKWHTKVADMEDDIEAVLREEKEEKVMAQTEMQMRRADNIMTHESEILGRQKKTWFESAKDKTAAKERGRAELNGPGGADGGGVKKEKKKKLSNKQKKRLEDRDERREGPGWKKGKAERDGKGVLAKAKGGGKGVKPGVKTTKPEVKTATKPAFKRSKPAGGSKRR